MRALRRGTAIPLAVLTILASLAGCAPTAAGGGALDGGGVAAPRPGDSGSPEAALAAWSTFPVDRQPRPIVLIGSSLVQYAGYTSGEAKIAAMSGSYRLAATPPPDPQPTPVDLPGGRSTLPVIGAAAAVDRMKMDAGDKPDPSVPPLAIVSFEFGTAPIDTDRGTLTLPVWRVHTADELGPTTVLAVGDSALAQRSGSTTSVPRPGSSAKVSTDGRHLTLTVQESVPHCPGEPIYQTTASVRESGTAVAVVFTRTQVSAIPADPNGACAAYIQLQPVTYRVDLAAPLGNRVLVDTAGDPLPVTTG